MTQIYHRHLYCTRDINYDWLLHHVHYYYIGGYQVCQKWLKDRKGRTLSDEDILHYHKIVVALAETIKLMQLIDAAISSFSIK
jgi:hypothetical protein